VGFLNKRDKVLTEDKTVETGGTDLVDAPPVCRAYNKLGNVSNQVVGELREV